MTKKEQGMPSSQDTELALRAAVNTNSRDISSSSGQADSIKSSVMDRLQSQATAKTGTGISGSTSEAVGLAVAGIVVAYIAISAISSQLGVLKNKRLAFDKEREVGIATFMMPHNKEERHLSNEEKVIKGFIELAAKYPSFYKYLGIHSADLVNDTSGKFYSVLPFYRMSEALGQPLASTKPIDRQRAAIDLFLKSSFPDAIADIDNGFQNDYQFVAFWESTFRGANYLNNRRAPRFIMIALSNLLWNIQHPVNTESGYPLGFNACIEICRDVELFLNQLLDNSSPPYVQIINSNENEIISFLRKIEIYTKTLRLAYSEEHLNELNIDEITNSAHSALRIMDKSIFKLIYHKENPVTAKYEPNDKAADDIACSIAYLNDLLIQSNELIEAFNPVPEWISPKAGINNPPMTTLDVLIIFCHLSHRERDEILNKIQKTHLSSALEFVHELKKFNQRFIKPIRTISKQELHAHASPGFEKFHEVGTLTARRLIPLFTLVIEDYRLEIDTSATYQRAKSSSESVENLKKYSGKQQAQAINLSAQAGGDYYYWKISPFTDGAIPLDDLPKNQYRMTQVAKLMDSISEIVKNYRSFLLHKTFQTFLITCLNKAKKEIMILGERITAAKILLENSGRINRGLQTILKPMMDQLNGNLEIFSLAMSNFEQVVSAPDFTDKQRQLLSSKISEIADQFSMLFLEDSGLAELIDSSGLTNSPSSNLRQLSASSEHVDLRKVLALTNLVQTCHDAMSSDSKKGHKGKLLRQLLKRIENSPSFTERDIAQIVMDVARITSNYRKTLFFQAAYGETKSAQAFIKAIKDEKLNKVLPMASILFDEVGIGMNRLTDDFILKRLRSLRETLPIWQDPTDQMELSWGENDILMII